MNRKQQLEAEIAEINKREEWIRKAKKLFNRSLKMIGAVSFQEVSKTETYLSIQELLNEPSTDS